MDQNEQADFDAFWLEYVREHSHPLNRKLHAIGISLALACLVAGIFKRKLSLLVLAPILGYGFAWFGHFFIEKNVPKSFSRPVDSLRASAILYWKTICGEMDAELERARQAETAAAPSAESTSVHVN
jgi:hypothetical protein